MKLFFKFMFMVTLFLASSNSAQAQEQSSRQGFFLNFGVGAGYEMNQFQEFGAVFALELGGGLNERFLLSGEIKGFSMDVDGVRVTMSQLMFNARYFVSEDTPFYVKGGVGLSLARAESDFSGLNISTESDLGFSLELAAGYEFRLGRKFYISPEAFFSYNLIEQESLPVLGTTARFGWYF